MTGQHSHKQSWLARLRGEKTELRVLGGFLGVALFGFVFLRIAAAVEGLSAEQFDHSLLLLFRAPGNLSDPIGPLWFEGAVRDVTALGSTIVLGFVFLSALFYLLMLRQYASATLITASVLGGLLLGNLLKFVYARPRPDLVPQMVEVFSYSFPSGHATMSAIVYLTLGALLAELHPSRRRKLYFLGLAVLLTIAVGLSRIYLGVHYPTDVIAGWCAGAAWALLCRTIMQWRRRSPMPELR